MTLQSSYVAWGRRQLRDSESSSAALRNSPGPVASLPCGVGSRALGEPEPTPAEQWSSSAEAWALAGEEPETGAGAEAARWMLETVSLEPGEQVLELACGAGRVGLQAAEVVGREGRVVCSDFAPEMVVAVERLAERLGRANVDSRILDALNLEVVPERFDAVLCRFGYMLMSDPLRALANSREVLTPDGRLVLAVWGEGKDNPWLMTIFDAVMGQLGAPPPEPGTPGPFALGDPVRLRNLLEEAGFSHVTVEVIETGQEYESLDAWWDEILAVSGPLAALFGALSEADQRAVRNRAFEVASGFQARAGVLEFPASVVGARAHR